MSLYPSLEDMKVDKILQTEQQQNAPPANRPAAPMHYPGSHPGSHPPAVAYGTPSAPIGGLYPSMNDYMGLDLTASEMEIIHRQQQQLQSMAIAQSQRVRLMPSS